MSFDHIKDTGDTLEEAQEKVFRRLLPGQEVAMEVVIKEGEQWTYAVYCVPPKEVLDVPE